MDDAFVSIYAGVGGPAALDFVEVLYRMYQRFIATQGWRIELFSVVDGMPSGLEAVEFFVHGEGAFERLDDEHGVHRFARTYEGESRPRAAFASVYVLRPESGLTLRDDDLRIETFSEVTSLNGDAETAGMVRIIHEPTGITVETNRGSDPGERKRALLVMATKLSSRNPGSEIDTLPGNLRRRYELDDGLVRDVVWGTESNQVERILDGELDLLEP